MDLGVFIPIGNNGWLISTTSPQYKPTFELNKEIVQRAERDDEIEGLVAERISVLRLVAEEAVFDVGVGVGEAVP